MIRFEHVSFQYKHSRKLLNDFSLEIPEHSRICFSAPSGKGKTTVFRLLLGLEHPTAGHITGTEGMAMSAVFQDDRLIPWKTVLENILLFATAPDAPGSSSSLSPVADAKEYALSLLNELGLKGTENMLPKELSGGMARRVSLARALCHRSDLLVLDEAFTGLDEDTRHTCLAVTDRLAAGRTLIMASHDLSDAEVLQADIVNL